VLLSCHFNKWELLLLLLLTLNCMFCWPCISIYLCNKNQLDALFILNLYRQWPGQHSQLKCKKRTNCYIYRMSQEECVRLREGVPYVKVYRHNPKHLCPKLNGYGDNGQRKVWSSLGFHALYLSDDGLMHARPSVWYHITAVQLTLSLNCICTSFRVIM
jgi:hypothetical protein